MLAVSLVSVIILVNFQVFFLFREGWGDVEADAEYMKLVD